MPTLTRCWKRFRLGWNPSAIQSTGARAGLAGLALLLSTLGAQAQLSGIKTIDPAGSGPNNYTSFTAAVNALNAGGNVTAAGGVTFNVAKVAFTEAAGVPAITVSGSAAAPIIFQENGLTPTNLADNPTITRTTGNTTLTDAVLAISGGDFITFDGISVVATTGLGTSSVEFGYLVRNASATNGAKNNTVRNARISLDRASNNTVGLLQSSSSSTTAGSLGGGGFAATAATGVNESNTYENLAVENSQRGISLFTSNTAAANYDLNNRILNCTIGGSSAGDIGGATTPATGILVQNQNNAVVAGNTVRNVTSAGSGTTGNAYGIFINEVFGTANYVYNNRVSGIRIVSATATSTAVAYGMVLDTDNSTVASGHRLTAYNNFVSDLSHNYSGTVGTTLRAVGIATQAAGTGANNFIEVYHNSVLIENPTGTTATTTAFASLTSTTTGARITLRNNIFANLTGAQTGAFKHYAIYSSSATLFGGPGSTSDFNDLYVSPTAGGFIGAAGTASDKLTLANWQATYAGAGQGGAAIDNSSVSVDPDFISMTDLHTTASGLNNAGTPISSTAPGIGQDIDGQARSATTPDIGADEFTPANNDVAVLSLSAPTSPVTSGPQSVSVLIENVGISTLNTVRLEYTLNGGAPVAQTFTIAGGLAPSATTTLTFSTQATLVSGANAFVVTGSLPNGSADPTAANNSISTTVYTGLSGTYTINRLAAASSTNFVSFTAAAAALNNGGILAAVRFDVLNGPYNEQFSLGEVAGVSPTDTIVVDGGASRQTLSYAGTVSQPAAILLNGTDYVTINNLTIDVAAGATYGIGVHLVGAANFNRVSNSVIRAPSAATSSVANYGVALSGSVTSGTTAGSGTDLRVENNTISGGYNAVIATGAAATVLSGIRVTNNVITDTYLYGLNLEFTDGATVVGNDISRPTRATLSTFAGMYFTGATLNAFVTRNRIHDPATAAPTSTSAAYGIYFTSADGTPGNGNVVFNNLVYNFVTAGVQYGIYSVGSDYGQFYHNTISLDHTASTSASVAYGFYQTTAADGVEFRNNIVSVTRGGSANRVALFFNTPASNITSNHNDLYVGTGGNFYTGSHGGVLYATLLDWQAANSNAYDQNSVQADPGFVGATLVPSSGVLNGAGDPALLPLVPRDFNNVVRNNPPDLGAYEFTPAANDVAVTGFVSPAPPAAAGSTPVTVTVLNNGGSTLTSVTLAYTYNGGAAVSQTFTGLSIASGASAPLTFSTPVVLMAGSATLTAVASAPNGGTDGDLSNNSFTTTFNTALSGTYTINDQAAASATNFVSFTAAAAALNNGGIMGGVQFNVLNGPYREQIELGQIAGVSTTDSVVFNGNGRIIRFGSADSNQRAVIKLNGTDYVSFNNLIIDATDNGATPAPTYGWGVHLTNGADYNSFRGCEIRSDLTSTSSVNYAGIVASNSNTSPTTTGNSANFLSLHNNIVSGGYYAIILNGASTTNRSQGLLLTNNEVRDFYQYGIDIENSNGARVVGNNIHRPNRTNGSTFYGVYLTGSIDAAIERNSIHHPFTGNPTSTSSAYGVYFTGNDAVAGSENDVVNNVIYEFNGSGLAYGIYNSGSDFARYYHNTISLDNTGVTTTTATAGFYQITQATGIEFVNNVVSVTRNPTGTGAKNALHFSTTASSIFSNHNDLYIGSGTNFYTGTYGTTTFALLSNWQTANTNSYDQNSIQANPLFASATSFVPTAPALNGAGSAATLARVPRDFNNVVRNSPPDLGAYEFTPVAIDLAPIALAAPTASQNCLSTAEPVIVTVRNQGTAALNFANNPASITVNVTGAATATLTGSISSGTLASGATRNVTLTPALNLGSVGTYTFAISASVAGDQNTSNTMLSPSPTVTVTAPVAGTLTPGAATLCVNGSITLTLAGSDNGNIQFQQSSDNVNFTDVTTGTGGTTASYTTGTLTQTTYFRAQTRCNSNVATSNVATVTVTNPQPVSTNAPQSICAGSTATLTVTGTTGQTFQFFDAATGGTALASTPGGTASSPTASYTTPVLNTSTTYYVETSANSTTTAGPVTNTAVGTAGGGINVTYALIFSVNSPTVLSGVHVYPTAAGTYTINYKSAGGTVLQSATGTFTAAQLNTKVLVPLNFNLQAGTGQLLEWNATGNTASAYRNTTGAVYPYVSGDSNVSITGNTFSSGAVYYYYFYDWQLGSVCTGARTPLQVNITPATTLSGTQSNVSGSYCDVNITGDVTLTGPLTVTGTLTLASGASLNTNCQTVSGSGSFVMQAGSTLLICSPAGISASGATGPIQVTGARTFSPDANYIYNGTVAQVTGNGLPTQVRTLTVNNAAGLTLSQGLRVAQVVRLSSGNLSTAGNGLTLLSSAAGTALVVNTSGLVLGTTTVQRYIDPSLNPGLGYRHYSAPVAGSTVADLATSTGFTPLVNPAYNTATQPGLVTPFPTVYGYDETRLATSPATGISSFDKGWFSPGSLSDPLQVGRGYTVNIGANQLVDFNGTLVNGDQTYTNLTRGSNAEAGWHFLGNPFPSPIDWSLLTPADFNNVDQAVYVYRSTGRYTGSYTTFVNGVGGQQEIATAQGFFVRTSTPGTGSLRLPNAIRTTTFSPQPAFNRTASTRPLVQLQLSGAAVTDAAYVYFEQGATAQTDSRHDAVKLPNTHGLNLSSTVAGANLAINGLPLLGSQATVVPLHVATPQAGTYTFAVAELVNFLPGTMVELRDALTGTVTQLQQGTRYSCTLPAGLAGTRFTLVFRPGAVTASQSALDAALVSLYPNPAHGRFTLQVPPVAGHAKVHTTLLNALGQVVAERTLSLSAAGATAEFNTGSLAPGVYTMQVRAGQLLVTKRVVVE